MSGMLEAGQSPAKVARWLQVSQNWSPSYRIHSKHKKYYHQEYQSRLTKAPQLAREPAAASGRRIFRQTVYSLLVDTVLYTRRPL
ncbi:hypothetical protein TNCV_1009871 [Trichonephila clavipes]|nr:hypothetical protein TNCV_1009871 [Trichonephila clavipes]